MILSSILVSFAWSCSILLFIVRSVSSKVSTRSPTAVFILYFDGNPPAWKEGCELYQISIGRYTPRQSLYTKDDFTGESSLKSRGADFISLILNEGQTGEKILVVGPKAFTHEGELANVPPIAELLSLPNVSVINHHHAEGVNNFSDYDKSFIFLYEPIPTVFELVVKRIHRDEDVCFDWEQIDLEKGGVRLEGVNRYVDSRVQRVYDKEVEKRLMQAITRLRQMLNAGKKCYLFTSEPVSGLPVKPIFFTLADAQQCQAESGTLDKFGEYLQTRADMFVDKIAESDNVSERTAYRRTAERCQKTKADIENRIHSLKSQGLSIRKISADLDISRGKVESILKKSNLSILRHPNYDK